MDHTHKACDDGKKTCHIPPTLLLALTLLCLFAPQTARADCTGPADPAGVIRYDSAEHMMTYCDGTDWIRMGKDVIAYGPARLSITGSVDSAVDPLNITVDGNIAYITDTWGATLQAFNISDETAPVFLDSDGTTEMKAHAKYGNYVFGVGGGNDIISSYNVSNPAAISFVSSVTDAVKLDFAVAIAIEPSGTYAYVIGYATSGQFTVVDISNPSNMLLLGSFADNTNMPIPAGAGGDGIAVKDSSYAYVISSSGLAIVDVSDPNAPFWVKNVAITAPTNVFVAGNYAYVVSDTQDRLSIVDITDPPNAGVVGSVSDAVLLDGAKAVTVTGNRTYIASKNYNGVTIVDVSDPADPKIIDSVADATLLDDVRDIATDGSFVYAVSQGASGVGGDKLVIISDNEYCGNPVASEGSIIYNSTLHVMKFCNGSDWIAMGPAMMMRVFVSSAATYDGNMGGLTGADANCQSLADAAGLSGTYMAWLGADAGTPSSRFYQSNTLPYRLIDGTLIANNWADLTDGSIQNNLNMTEQGVSFGTTVFVRSNVSASGGLVNGANDCSDYTSNASTTHGNAITDTTDSRWTNNGSSGSGCSNTYRMYCFQQDSGYPTGASLGAGCANPAGVEGQMVFNSTYNTMQYCNGYDWIGIRGFKCDTSGLSFTFTDQTDVARSTVIESDKQQITGMACNSAPVSISGDGSPQFRTCDDTGCTVNVSAWQTSGTIDTGQYLQLKMTSAYDDDFSTLTRSATVTVEDKSDTWSVTTAPPKQVFVYNGTALKAGDILSLANADSLCQSNATANGISGTFKAWLSSSTSSVNNRFTKYTDRSYRAPQGCGSSGDDKYADSWADLTDGTIDHAIRKYSSCSTAHSIWIWTGTTDSGDFDTAANTMCDDWTFSGGGAKTATYGYTTTCTGCSNVSSWSKSGLSGCSSTYQLYCFEQ